MVRGKGKQKNVLSITEVETIKSEKHDLEDILKDSEGSGIGTAAEQIDKNAIKREINRLTRVLDESKPVRLSGIQKDAMAKREHELEEAFVQGLPSRYEMDHPSKCPGAVKKHMTWLVRNEKTGLVNEYRNIQRTLRPGEERSIEGLRKDGQRGDGKG